MWLLGGRSLVVVGWEVPGGFLPGRADEELERLADGQRLGDGLGQRQIGVDAVPIAPAVIVLDDVAGVGEVGDDAAHAAFGDL